MQIADAKIAVIGLGYVGLPLAVEFGMTRPTIGFDVNAARVTSLQNHQDTTLEMTSEELAAASHMQVTSDLNALRDCNTYIVTVPTPIDAYKRPDLTPLIKASRTIGQVISKGDVVIYESTVYPGATEEDCVPVIEATSGLVFNQDFWVGYSPERINPGDKTRRLPDIIKVTSGSTPEAADYVDALYNSIVTAGTHKAPSIKVAEAAKVIENTQRDVNIALINELALIFYRMDIDTLDVLEAAGTKWNFLPFRPGLVGGHCIGVDPYYLTHKSQSLGYKPEVVLSGRRINDGMGAHVAHRLVKEMNQRQGVLKGSRVLIMGLTFKENCTDLRNTRVTDVIKELETFGITVDVTDPWVDPVEAKKVYGLTMVPPQTDHYDGVLVAVAHREFQDMGLAGITALTKGDAAVIFDLKALLPRTDGIIRL